MRTEIVPVRPGIQGHFSSQHPHTGKWIQVAESRKSQTEQVSAHIAHTEMRILRQSGCRIGGRQSAEGASLGQQVWHT